MGLNYLNRCRFVATSSGTGAFVVSAADTNMRTPAQCAGPAVVNNDTYEYLAYQGSDWEIGRGVYTTSNTQLTRGTVYDSTNGGSRVSFAAAPTVAMGLPLSQNLIPVPAQIFTTTGTLTITIPDGAGKALFILQGGGGGANNTGVGGGGACVFKFLSGLTPGNTLNGSIGAGGGAGLSGANTTLSSGTQSITTLTAGGGSGGDGSSGGGGTATNGDLNIPGGQGRVISSDFHAGESFLSANITTGSNSAGKLYGGGAAGSSSSGAQGCIIVIWYP